MVQEMGLTQLQGPRKIKRSQVLTTVAAAVVVGVVAFVAIHASADITPPTVPTNVQWTGHTISSLTISWNASTDTESGVKDYIVYRDGNPLPTKATATPNPTFTDTGLWPHSTHSYYISAEDNAGNMSAHSLGNITGFTDPDIQGPTAPPNFAAVFHKDTSPISVSMTWGAATDNYAVDHYDIFRDLVKIGSSKTLNYTDTTAQANQTYKYFVQGVDEINNTGQSSNQVTVITDTQKPSVPADLHITAQSTNSVSLAWTASTDNYSVASYNILRDGVVVANQSWGLGPIFLDSDHGKGLNPGTTYSYQVQAVDGNGNLSAPCDAVPGTTTGGSDTQAPVANITAPTPNASVSGNKVSITATATDNVGVIKVLFTVDGQSPLATVTAAPYTYSWDTTAYPNGSHSISVYAYDAAGNVGTAPTVLVTVANGDTIAPSTPANVAAKAVSTTQVNLSWVAASDNTGVAGYYVRRNGVTIAQVAGKATSYANVGLSPNTNYNYQVVAYDAAINYSSASNTVSVTTKSPSGTDTIAPTWPAACVSSNNCLSGSAPNPAQVNLSWKNAADNVGIAGYYVYRNGSKVATVTTNSLGDSGLSASTSYSYYVVAFDAAGKLSSTSNTVAITTPGQTAGGNLTGRVTDGSTNVGLVSTIVWITPNGTHHTKTANSQGYYYLNNLPAVNLSFNYSYQGFQPASKSVTVQKSQTLTQNVGLSK